MKIGELRDKLKKLKKEELIKVASEFYKLIPRAKRLEYDLEALVTNPEGEQKAKKTDKAKVTLTKLKKEIETFIEHAEEGYYYERNSVVPKKKRIGWRFRVKKWYEELINQKREDKDLPLQIALLKQLYEVLEEGGDCYFTAEDPFSSVGIDEAAFLNAMFILIEADEGKVGVAEKGMNLIVTYYDDFFAYAVIDSFIAMMNTPDLKYIAIKSIKKEITELQNLPPLDTTGRDGYTNSKQMEYRQELNNVLTIIATELYLSLFEYDEAVALHQAHYKDTESDTLVSILALLEVEKLYPQMKKVMEDAVNNGMKLDNRLLPVFENLKAGKKLPNNW